MLQKQFAGRRILLVEDEPVNQETTCLILENTGIKIDVAEDGQAAVDLIAHEDYDLILMDMQMPVLNGLEATLLIRQSDRFKYLPIIAMTANAFAEDRELCMAAGMNDFISKPIAPDVLLDMLLKWLKQPPSDGTDPQEARLVLDASLLTGLSAVDQEHQMLFDQLNRLVDASHTDSDRDLFSDVLTQLGQLVSWHFRNEEVVMRDCAMPPPEFDRHLAAHQQILREYTQLHLDLMSGQSFDRKAIVELIKGWLHTHIVMFDIKIREYLVNPGFKNP